MLSKNVLPKKLYLVCLFLVEALLKEHIICSEKLTFDKKETFFIKVANYKGIINFKNYTSCLYEDPLYNKTDRNIVDVMLMQQIHFCLTTTLIVKLI